MTHKIVAANWKMHGTKQSVAALLADIQNALKKGVHTSKVVVFAPYIFLPLLEQTLANDSIDCGAQNLNEHDQGAYTAEISAQMLRQFGCQYVLVGHSERRQLFGESDALIAQKFVQAQANSLTPMLCVGETLAEREAEQTLSVITRQLTAVIEATGIAALKQAVIAYEPVWAIGTGKTATPEQAQDVHAGIRAFLASYDQLIAEKISLLYGGSVKANNATALFAMPDIDGALVGGASLDAKQFVDIIQAAG